MERKYKKEREAEGEMFADKDAYVTEAYKKRLEEIRLAEEAERMREEADGMRWSPTHCFCEASPPMGLHE
jgi:hypothetical protein